MAQTIVDIMIEKQLFASIDIHNNTGLNPHYSCINKLAPQFFQLATLFGRFVVYFTRPKGVQASVSLSFVPLSRSSVAGPGSNTVSIMLLNL
jgi:hypothetical protein